MTTQARVLVVDDDPVVAKSIDRVLSGKGYAVITARDGREALDKLAQEKYDAVFTDIRMPGMDGLEVAARIRSSQPWLPVVIVTGYGSLSSEAWARKAGVSDFLHKPLSHEMIEESARKAMQRGAEATLPPPAADIPAGMSAPADVPFVAPSAARTAKNLALFVAAPFIGLAYALAFPVVGLVLLVRFGVRALMRKAGQR